MNPLQPASTQCGVIWCVTLSCTLTRSAVTNSLNFLTSVLCCVVFCLCVCVCLRFGATVQSLELTGLGHSMEKPLPLLLQPAMEDSVTKGRPLISLEFTKAAGLESCGNPARAVRQAAHQLIFDYEVEVTLEQVVFIFDKNTAIKVAQVVDVIIASSSSQ